jgi:hypothetical protein
MPLQATSGAASYDAFGGGAAAVPQYIEDVFNTWLYTGTGASQTITNSIDLSTKGGLVWIKSRSATYNHSLFDTARGATKAINSNLTTAQVTDANSLTAFNTTGFTLGSGNTTGTEVNTSSATFASWTFRKQPKFFDIVTYTGNGSARTIAHNLGSVPGCIIIKSPSANDDWFVYHRSIGATKALSLSSTEASFTSSAWNNTTPTSSVFSLGSVTDTNTSGRSYIAYIYAHNAGGFGLTGTDNVISCGSFTTDGGGIASVNLGYEPQWLMTKTTTTVQSWKIVDNMRAFVVTDKDSVLNPNLSDAETVNTSVANPTATGFDFDSGPSDTTFIYIAIRRGPMKVPTVGTTVFAPVTYTGNNTTRTITTNFPVSQYFIFRRDATSVNNIAVFDRLRGYRLRLLSSGTGAESSDITFPYLDSNTGVVLQGGVFNTSGESRGIWAFQRAPSFFDEVCYTGTGSANQRVSHNLAAVPELIIVRGRTSGNGWYTYVATLGRNNYLAVNSTAAIDSNTNAWGTSNPTTTDFGIDNTWFGLDGVAVVAYLFATCAGVSKVGSYTGNGSTQTINCGFGAGGARFVLIKRTDATGDWYTYDTARGMTTLTDPYLLLNSTAAEVATLGSVTTVSTGFALNSTILAAINVNGGNYIFLAIA